MKAPLGRVLGLGLVVLSTILYLCLLGVPMLPLTTEQKLALSGALVLAGEASFWIGGLLLGREFVRKYRSALNPLRWFKRKGSEGTPGHSDEER